MTEYFKVLSTERLVKIQENSRNKGLVNTLPKPLLDNLDPNGVHVMDAIEETMAWARDELIPIKRVTFWVKETDALTTKRFDVTPEDYETFSEQEGITA